MQEIKTQLTQTLNIEYKSQSTKKIYQFHIDGFLSKYNNPKQEDILTYLNWLVEFRKYKPSSLSLAKYSLIYYFTKILHQQITIYIPKIKKEKQLPRFHNKSIILAMIEALPNIKHKIMVCLLYGSGLRKSELLYLKWQDIDFENKLVRVNGGKGKKDRITILSQMALDDLLVYRSKRTDNNQYIFVSDFDSNKLLSDRTIGEVLKNACKKLGLRYKINPHSLRHSLATHLVEQDVNLSKIQDLLGHSSLNTTKIYIHTAKKDLMEIKNPLDS